MLIKLSESNPARAIDITPRAIWRERRALVAAAASAGALGVAHPTTAIAQAKSTTIMQGGDPSAQKLAATASKYSTPERATTYKLVTTYNNFYEFGTEKDDPVRYAQRLRTKPWSVMVDGEVAKPRSFDIDELLTLAPLEERIYRMRCVEGWSMVIPWIGYSMSELIRRVEPTSKARYVEFVTLADPKQMPGLAMPVIAWPYMDALRLDEAMHPLTLLTLGLYGEVLPKQNGAPVRMVVPWKYGFKSAKSLVRIRFTEREPVTSWMRSSPEEYGFYSNVNPEVSHPRWSQATERRLGEDGFMQRRRPTLMFNGYADQVAGLYAGMDLRKNF